MNLNVQPLFSLKVIFIMCNINLLYSYITFGMIWRWSMCPHCSDPGFSDKSNYYLLGHRLKNNFAYQRQYFVHFVHSFISAHATKGDQREQRLENTQQWRMLGAPYFIIIRDIRTIQSRPIHNSIKRWDWTALCSW